MSETPTSRDNERPLHPSLGVLEQQLLAPSEALLEAWAADQIDPGLRAALEADPRARQALEDWQAAAAEPDPEPEVASEATPEQPLPAPLRELIARAEAAREADWGGADTPPAVGQVRLVAVPATAPWAPVRPLAVLLLERGTLTGVWRGLVVAPEVDYAGPEDVLLEADLDEPFDPSAGMVQTWHARYCPAARLGRSIAWLTPERLTAVRTVAEEPASTPPDPTQARPGSVEVRAIAGGYRVLTGTPLGGDDDPRVRYRTLYEEAATAWIGERAPISSPEAAPGLGELAAALGRRAAGVVEGLAERARALGEAVQPVPEVAHALAGPEAGAERIQLTDQLRLWAREEETSVVLELEWLGQSSCIVTLQEAGLPAERLQLQPGQPTGQLLLDPAAAAELRIEALEAKPLVLYLPVTGDERP